jgi:hypothetical protein
MIPAETDLGAPYLFFPWGHATMFGLRARELRSRLPVVFRELGEQFGACFVIGSANGCD